MVVLLLFIALAAYGARYAFSGMDNALYYAVRTGRRVDIPDIHTAEFWQQTCSHITWACLTFLIEPTWRVVFLWLAAWGAMNAASYWFNMWILRATGTRRETTSWHLPGIGNIPKPFAGRRTLQVAVGWVTAVAAVVAYYYV